MKLDYGIKSQNSNVYLLEIQVGNQCSSTPEWQPVMWLDVWCIPLNVSSSTHVFTDDRILPFQIPEWYSIEYIIYIYIYKYYQWIS